MKYVLFWLVLGTLGIMTWIRRQSLRGAIQFVAKRFGGMTASNTFWLWGYPRAIFRYHDETVSVSATRGWQLWGAARTRLQFAWPDPHLSLWVADRPRELRRAVRRLHPLPLDPSVTPLLAWTNHPAKGAELLTGPVIWQLEQLRQRARRGRLTLQIQRQRVVLKIGGHFLAEERLYDLVVAALQLFDQMRLSQQRDVEFVAPEVAQVVDDFLCPVCSSRATEHIVLCLRCKTPHCEECWQFNGKCATYGCGEMKFIKF